MLLFNLRGWVKPVIEHHLYVRVFSGFFFSSLWRLIKASTSSFEIPSSLAINIKSTHSGSYEVCNPDDPFPLCILQWENRIISRCPTCEMSLYRFPLFIFSPLSSIKVSCCILCRHLLKKMIFVRRDLQKKRVRTTKIDEFCNRDLSSLSVWIR